MFSLFTPPKSHPLNRPQGPWRVRIAREGYEDLDPLGVPWDQLARDPGQFPDWHVAKLDVARMVVGMPCQNGRGAERVYIKRNPVRTAWQRLKARLRPSKEWREWIIAEAMATAGVQVPQPLFYGEAMDPDSGDTIVFLATRSLTPNWREWMSYVRDHGAFGIEWQSLARFTRQLHQLGIYHADYRAPHLYFDPARLNEHDDLSAWALIDLDGSWVGRPVSRAQRQRALLQLCRSMCRVGMQREHFEAFLAIYDPANEGRWDIAAMYESAYRRVTSRGAKTI